MTEQMKVDGVTLQTQPDMKTCMHTCLAMALNVPVAAIIGQHGGEIIGVQRMCSILELHGMIWNRLVFGAIVHPGWYFASVASLNIRGGLHEVLIFWDGLSENIQVLDPACRDKYLVDGSDMPSWTDLIEFRPERGDA